ncbi:L,D-transpeptidase family protein [Parablastomonas sp. CN1-191]|uniref:L,D-transpeptidase family protein n=1 Tax=Parablastomonas sp. CN1-191 TaxID=3400908 RepID=UPI003BF88B56
MIISSPSRGRSRIAPGAAIGVLAVLLALGGCNVGGTSQDQQQPQGQQPSQAATPTADQLGARDPAPGQQAAQDIPDPEARPVMQAQVVLDRLGFTPGVVDGKAGLSTKNAILGFQEANGIDQSGEMDDATKAKLAQWQNIPATRVVTIPDAFAAGPFYAVPAKAEDQAKMQALGYSSLDEKLAERFHTTIATLKALNPNGMPAGASGPATASPSASTTPAPTPTPSAVASSGDFVPQPGPPSYFRAGQQIRVPNVGADQMAAGSVDDAQWAATLTMLGVGSDQPKVDKIVVSKSKGWLKGYDASGKLVAMYTATMGSTHDPLPLGTWKVNGIARNTPFNYNPALFWDAKPGDKEAKLPPGPNGPVGVVWIDLSKEHYGIHGTPSPETIGRAESHGCVRLTNWDAARLAQMVKAGTQVLFEA